jgi:hypothetical protein
LQSPVHRELWDEINEIGRDPIGRGSPYEDDDPSFANQRVGLGVAGFAIFYLPMASGGAYVTEIRLWDYT